MIRLILTGFILGIFITSCNTNMGQEHKYTNALIDETSPYLLQHAHNPVNWQPWGEKALEEAQEKNKLIIVSIGYAACHWCHVMEHESFEDSTIAAKMNEKYVSIKVDREERPDIDQIYMDAANLLTGRGGWPLNVITLPDGRPIFAGTYFPRDNWEKVLDYFIDVYENEPEKALEQAEKVTKGIAENGMPTFNEEGIVYNEDSALAIRKRYIESIDFEYGGRTGAPKFPIPTVYEALLVDIYFDPNEEIQQAIRITLDKMANGGIYDHLGGGFSRYSTDDQWIVPHFEKMMYDNAQLISLYSHAYQAFGDKKYKQAVIETIEFCNRELLDPNGAYYTSIDADSEGEEGKFYVWREEEIDSLLKDDAEVFKKFYQITKRGNFEGNNILVRIDDTESLKQQFNIDESELYDRISSAKSSLLAARNQRVRPALDNKILTSLNALMIVGLIDAHFALQNENYLEKAVITGKFLLSNQIEQSGHIYRDYKTKGHKINGFLDDYAFTIQAFIRLYEATFDESWLYEAKKIKEYVDVHFFDDKTQMYFYTADNDEKLIARKMELNDGDTPSSNSAMAHVLFQLGQYFYNTDDVKRAEQMVANSQTNFTSYPHYYSNWARLYQLMGHKHFEVAIVGEESESKRQELMKMFVPNKILLGGTEEGTLELLKGKLAEGSTFIYVCTNKSCKLPVKEAKEALKQMR